VPSLDVSLHRLHRAKRLSEEFLHSLLSWQRSGFSAHADKPVEAVGRSSLERLLRYITRAPIRIDSIEIDDEGHVRIATPPDPKSGTTELVVDPLEWIHAIASKISERRAKSTIDQLLSWSPTCGELY
jgi:hypothetical protein